MVEVERETDGRWTAEIAALPGVESISPPPDRPPFDQAFPTTPSSAPSSSASPQPQKPPAPRPQDAPLK